MDGWMMRMNEWMNEWMNMRMNVYEWVKVCVCESVNEREDEWMWERMCESACVDGCVWMNVWMNECKCVCGEKRGSNVNGSMLVRLWWMLEVREKKRCMNRLMKIENNKCTISQVDDTRKKEIN